MRSRTRKKDYVIEQIANKFEDMYCWPRQLGEALSCMTRYDDTTHQFAGIDYSLYTPKGLVNIDSKVKYKNCLNQVLQTPGFEMSIRNAADDIQDGWLVADGMKTDYYEIIGLSCTTNDHNKLSAFEQLTGIDILLVKKDELFKYIEQYTPIEQLKQDAKTLRESFDRGESYDLINQFIYGKRPKSRMFYKHRKFHLAYSPTLDEQPVNLVVYRDALQNLKGARHWTVTKDYVKNEIES